MLNFPNRAGRTYDVRESEKPSNSLHANRLDDEVTISTKLCHIQQGKLKDSES